MEGECIDERLYPLDMIQTCRDSKDCAGTWGHFNGGCCGRSEITKGADLLDPETRKIWDLQTDGQGLCVPRIQADFMEKQGEVNLMEYNRYNFENDWVTRNIWLNDMPYNDRDDVKWEDMMEYVRKEYPEFEKERDIWFKGYCIDGRLPGQEPDYDDWMKEMMADQDWDWAKWERMGEIFDDVEVEMGDNFMNLSGPGMRIEMMEGEDGSGSMRIVLESATKLAASALSIGAALTLF